MNPHYPSSSPVFPCPYQLHFHLCLCAFPQFSPVSQVPPLWCCPTPLFCVLFAKVPNPPLTFSGCTQLSSGGLSSGTRHTRDGSRGWLWGLGVISWGGMSNLPNFCCQPKLRGRFQLKNQGCQSPALLLPGKRRLLEGKALGNALFPSTGKYPSPHIQDIHVDFSLWCKESKSSLVDPNSFL